MSASQAADVLPAIGGGQVTASSGAPMKHIGISFDGVNLEAHVGDSVSIPQLRKLSETDQFNAAEAWAVLDGKHYNFQYGWVPEGIWSPPAGAAVWIEHQDASSNLEVYEGGRFMSEGTIRAMTFDPLFGTSGSSDIWKWHGVMTHNAYAVADPQAPEYMASYRVYMGDADSGAELFDAAGAPLYGSDEVALTFSSPVPEPTSAVLALSGVAILGLARQRRRL